MDCRVEFLTKNRKYRIVHMDGEHYILDMEKSFWLIFIPILLWIMPQKMYKVDSKIVEQLKASTSSSSKSLGIVMIGAGGAAILTPIIKPILDYTIETTELVNLVLLIGSAVLIIFFRLYLRVFLHNQLYDKVDIDKADTVKVKIRPKYFSQYFYPFFLYLVTGVFTVGSFILFLETSNFIPLVTFSIILPMFSLLNWTVIQPDFGKTNLYRVSYVSK